MTVRYHALSPNEILEAIDKIGTPTEIVHQRYRTKLVKQGDGTVIRVPAPDNFAIFVKLQGGKECVAIVEFHSTIDKQYVVKDGHGEAYHTTVTVFEPDVVRNGFPFDYVDYLLDNENNFELDMDITEENPESEVATSETLTTTSEKEFSDNIIPQKSDLSTQSSNKISEDVLLSDRDPDALTNREILANLIESEDMSPSEKGFLTKYKNKIAQIEANEAEIPEMESELKELRKAGKKDSSRAITLEGKIDARRKEIARDENMILNLESTNSIKRLLKREKDSAYIHARSDLERQITDASVLYLGENKKKKPKHGFKPAASMCLWGNPSLVSFVVYHKRMDLSIKKAKKNLEIRAKLPKTSTSWIS